MVWRRGPIKSKCYLNKVIFTGLYVIEGRRQPGASPAGRWGRAGRGEHEETEWAPVGSYETTRGLASAHLVQRIQYLFCFAFPSILDGSGLESGELKWCWQYHDIYDHPLVSWRKTHRYQTL